MKTTSFLKALFEEYDLKEEDNISIRIGKDRDDILIASFFNISSFNENKLTTLHTVHLFTENGDKGYLYFTYFPAGYIEIEEFIVEIKRKNHGRHLITTFHSILDSLQKEISRHKKLKSITSIKGLLRAKPPLTDSELAEIYKRFDYSVTETEINKDL